MPVLLWFFACGFKFGFISSFQSLNFDAFCAQFTQATVAVCGAVGTALHSEHNGRF